MSEITKERAREILEEFYTSQICGQIDIGQSPWLSLPVKDEVVYSRWYDREGNPSNKSEDNYCLVQFSFKRLVKIAYDLQDKP